MGRSTGFRAPAIPEICLPGEGMHLLSRCSVGSPSGAPVLVTGPVLFTLVQLGAIGLWSALMSLTRYAHGERPLSDQTRRRKKRLEKYFRKTP